MTDTDIVADLRECAAESRDLEGDYYADQFATAPEIFERAADEIERLRDAIRRLADQDATLSVQGGNVTVTMDATLTDEEREAVETADAYMSAAGCHNTNVQKTLRGLLERTSHDAVPEAKAESDEARTDKAATSHRRDGTGDTPSEAEIDALEFVVVNGHTASIGDYGILRQWLIRLRPEFDSAEAIDEDESDRPKPIENGPDPDSRVWETPAKTHPTPPRNGTPAEGSVQGEGKFRDSQNAQEPVAWWLKGCEYDTGCEYEYVSLVKESADEAAREGGTVVPLYLAPALTDAEREAVAYYIGTGGPDAIDATLRGLLERLK